MAGQEGGWVGGCLQVNTGRWRVVWPEINGGALCLSVMLAGEEWPPASGQPTHTCLLCHTLLPACPPARCPPACLTAGPQRHSYLLVLDAVSMAELARADVDHVIAFGFHGNFLAADGSSTEVA